MKALYDLPAPAKLNLFLHITGRRADGYHLLQSVFMLIDWCDTLHVERRSDGQLTREDLTTPLPADDLVLRAAQGAAGLCGNDAGRPHRHRQAGAGAGRHGRRLLGRSHLPAGAQPPVGPEPAAVRSWSRSASRWAPTCPFSCAGATPGSKASASRSRRSSCRRGASPSSSRPQGLDTRLIFAAPDLQRATPAAIISGFAANAEQDGGEIKSLGFGHNDLQPVAQRLCPAVTEAIAMARSPRTRGSHDRFGKFGVRGNAA